MSEIGWSDLPVLPLSCIMEHLCLTDILAASSTCRNWRDGLFLYSLRREKLILQATEMEKSVFLTNMFLKNVKKVQFHLDCYGPQLKEFIDDILSKYTNACSLEDIVILGPGYLKLKLLSPLFKINSEPVDSLLLAHKNKLKSYTILGCHLLQSDPVTVSSQPGKRPALPYESYALQTCSFMPKCTDFFTFNYLWHICMEYDMLNTVVLSELRILPSLRHLSINIINKRRQTFERLSWDVLNYDCGYRTKEIQVTLNIIGVPAEKFEDIIENVLLEEMPLVALRVFFCKTFQPMMLHHIVETYCSTFKELQWVDAQLATSEMNRHVSTRLPQTSDSNLSKPIQCELSPINKKVDAHCHQYNAKVESQRPFRRETSINPLILVCWQCNVLEKIVLHGYWLWQYDLLGMARLRHSTLRHLEVSATYQKEMGCRVITEAMTILPVFVGKEERNVDPSFIKQMNDCLNFEWRPSLPWNQLHPALGPYSNETLRSDYVRNEIMSPLGVT